jgi:hypothetical protein
VPTDPVFTDPVLIDPVLIDPVLIDCDRCAARPAACGDCVVTLLLATPAAVSGEPTPGELTLDGADHDALRVLADAGLAPRLRHVPAPIPGHVPVRRAG